MRHTFALTGLLVAVCAMASAQDSSGNLVIQGHGGAKPRVVNATSHNGPITIKTYSGNDLMVAPCGNRVIEPRRGRVVPDGMHRLPVGGRGVEVEEQDNVFTVRDTESSGCMSLIVPVQTSLKLTAHNGHVDVDGVQGDIEVEAHNGHVTLTNISGSANVSSRNGAIRAQMDRVDTGKPSSFSTSNSRLDVTLPGDLKANLKMKVFQGDIWTDFDVMMSGARAAQPNSTSNGKYRVSFDRTMMGTINGGGVELSFTTMNGSILIHKKK